MSIIANKRMTVSMKSRMLKRGRFTQNPYWALALGKWVGVAGIEYIHPKLRVTFARAYPDLLEIHEEKSGDDPSSTHYEPI